MTYSGWLVRGAVLAMAVGGADVRAIEYAQGVRGALDSGHVGLRSATDFRLTNGACSDCTTIPQALWYFREDLVAVPKLASAGFSRGLPALRDVTEWASADKGVLSGGLPPLAWVGSPQVAEAWRLASDGTSISGPAGNTLPFAVVSRLASNHSYYAVNSIHYFSGRSLSLRGQIDKGRFIARSIWPDDFRIDVASAPLQPLADGETIYSMVRADGGGARQAFAARRLWQRSEPGPQGWNGKPVLAMILNGAQGDDDEAHGGHFAIATGRFGEKGEWRDWLVNNFYNLDSVSEKGIIASSLPMDAYMGDLNSGQAWYRPSYMLVAVLKQDRAATLYQGAISRVFNHFYRHDFVYRHATANCAGISIDTLRALNWQVPRQGPTSMLKAIAGLPYMAVKEGSLDSGRKAFDYMSAERTALYPLVAFEAIGRDILERLVAGKQGNSGLERMLAEDIEALIYVRIPQFPSSRAFGQAPVASFDEYMQRVPADRKDWKIIPVPPRPFPATLNDGDGMPLPIEASSIALAAYGGFFGVTAVGLWHRRSRRRRAG